MANPNKTVTQLADANQNGMIAAQQALVADAETAHSTATTTDLDALGTKINAILDILEAHGLMADA